MEGFIGLSLAGVGMDRWVARMGWVGQYNTTHTYTGNNASLFYMGGVVFWCWGGEDGSGGEARLSLKLIGLEMAGIVMRIKRRYRMRKFNSNTHPPLSFDVDPSTPASSHHTNTHQSLSYFPNSKPQSIITHQVVDTDSHPPQAAPSQSLCPTLNTAVGHRCVPVVHL